MAHLHLPPGGDPTTIAWIKLPRWRRRLARAQARAHMKSAAFVKENGALTKAQRRQATPWQPLVLTPGDAHFLSGMMTSEGARLILLGLNRRERRALRSKAGPGMQHFRSGNDPDPFERLALEAALGGHVARSDRRTTPLLSKAFAMAKAERRRMEFAEAKDFADSFKGRAMKAAATVAAVPTVIGKRVANLFRRSKGAQEA